MRTGNPRLGYGAIAGSGCCNEGLEPLLLDCYRLRNPRAGPTPFAPAFSVGSEIGS